MPHDDETDQRPDAAVADVPADATVITGVPAVDALIAGIQDTEAALVALEALVAAHGSQPTTRAVAAAALKAFTDAWQATSASALEQSARLAAHDNVFAATRPRAYPRQAARQLAETIGVMLIERSHAAEACLRYLQGAAARAQMAVARLAAADRADTAAKAAKATKETPHG